jgi:hypothetical protein
MSKVMLQVNVAYPAHFIERFTQQAFERQDAGETHYWDGGEVEEQNRVYVIMDWASAESAWDFWTSDTGLAHIEAWRSMRTEFTLLDGKTH